MHDVNIWLKWYNIDENIMNRKRKIKKKKLKTGRTTKQLVKKVNSEEKYKNNCTGTLLASAGDVPHYH